MVDVWSFDEFFGKVIYMFNYLQEGVLCGGYIFGVCNIFWVKVINEDGIFKFVDELKVLYEGEGVIVDKDVIVYCCIVECFSYSWFVLCELLGYFKVCNYDGLWIEWGNGVGLFIEKIYSEE